MPSLTYRNREHLEQRFARDTKGGYAAHQPIWGYGQGTSESGHLARFARTLNLLRTISGLEIESFLDVGGAEGYMGTLVRHFFGARAITSDLSLEAANRASELFGLRSCSANAARLPFRADSFDLVLFSEVLEHLERPFVSLLETLRVAKKYLIISTEASTSSSLKRKFMLKTRPNKTPHFDRNIWTAGDFRAMFGDSCAIRPQFRTAERQDVPGADRAREKLFEVADVHEVGRHTAGLLVVVAKHGQRIPEPVRSHDQGFCDLLFRGPLSEPLESEVWERQDMDKLSIPRGAAGVSTLDLFLDADRDDAECFQNNKAIRSLMEQFSEDNIASGLSYAFYRVLRRALRSRG
ncbi:MAG: class I SAM-dependent methyltransferase [Bryobacteraceae bacterium]|jgi:SAM-dependent methyltransferase